MQQQLTLVFRSLVRGGFYSLVNIVGLALAMAVVLLVTLLIRHETSFDSGRPDLYRLAWQSTGTGDRFATLFNPFSPQLKREFDAVQEAARLGIFEMTLQRPGSAVAARWESVAAVDPAFPELLGINFLEGDPSALAQSGVVVLSRSAAKRYFGDEGVLGQTLELERRLPLKVVAVVEDPPLNSHLTTHFYVPMDTLRTLYDGAGWLENWGSDRLFHYVRLAPGTDVERLESQMPAFLQRHDQEWPEGTVRIQFLPLEALHFTTDLQDDVPVRDVIGEVVKAPRERSDLALFSAGALFLVLVAGFNFMNLQIARSVGRARQVGMLKVLGADRKAVIRHVLLESVAQCSVAVVLAVILAELLTGPFSALLGVTFPANALYQPSMAGMAVLMALALGLLTGAYPALMMAAQNPSQVMKGEFRLGHGAGQVRSVLVFAQFAVSVVLIIISLVIFLQVRFTMDIPAGFNPEQRALVTLDREAARNYESLRVQLMEQSGVESVSRGSIVPTQNLSDGSALVPDDGREELAMRFVLADYDYFETLGIEVLAGRSYSREHGGDAFRFPSAEEPVAESAIIINERTALRAGWGREGDYREAIGHIMSTAHTIDGVEMIMRFRVVGVVRDAHFRSLRSEVVPMAYYLSGRGSQMIARFDPSLSRAAAEQQLNDWWAQVAPETPLRLQWMEDALASLYAQERRSFQLMTAISLLAIGMACIGLFAVVSLMTRLRTREIGIRKILGAGLSEIINLLSWQFLKPVLLANLLAWPLAWLFLNDWLRMFAYRIEPGVLVFAGPGALVFVLAWVTVAGLAWRAASANPIHALRYE